MAHDEASLHPDPDGRCGGGRCAADSGSDALWRIAAAELAGSALLVLLTCLAGAGPVAQQQPLARALAGGLVVAALVQALDHVSGAQFNPTVTLAAALWGRFGRRRAAAMLGAQLAGACLGAAALLGGPWQGALGLCVTRPWEGRAWAAAGVEAALGGCLALLNCASWDPRVASLRDSWPLRVGLSVAGLSLVGVELSGASMNPVRSFGPALCSGDWTHHWVYWVGPLGGSALATGLYVVAWRPRDWRPAQGRPCDWRPAQGRQPDAKAPLPPAPSKLHRSV